MASNIPEDVKTQATEVTDQMTNSPEIDPQDPMEALDDNIYAPIPHYELSVDITELDEPERGSGGLSRF